MTGVDIHTLNLGSVEHEHSLIRLCEQKIMSFEIKSLFTSGEKTAKYCGCHQTKHYFVNNETTVYQHTNCKQGEKMNE